MYANGASSALFSVNWMRTKKHHCLHHSTPPHKVSEQVTRIIVVLGASFLTSFICVSGAQSMTATAAAALFSSTFLASPPPTPNVSGEYGVWGAVTMESSSLIMETQWERESGGCCQCVNGQESLWVKYDFFDTSDAVGRGEKQSGGAIATIFPAVFFVSRC